MEPKYTTVNPKWATFRKVFVAAVMVAFTFTLLSVWDCMDSDEIISFDISHWDTWEILIMMCVSAYSIATCAYTLIRMGRTYSKKRCVIISVEMTDFEYEAHASRMKRLAEKLESDYLWQGAKVNFEIKKRI